MNKYQFPSEHLAGVTAHIAAYDFKILSMMSVDNSYIVETNQAIVPDEVTHLNDAYGLVEVA